MAIDRMPVFHSGVLAKAERKFEDCCNGPAFFREGVRAEFPESRDPEDFCIFLCNLLLFATLCLSAATQNLDL